ncbi:site-specific integrase [Zunongwangia endophytica]|uniref:Site-specific integrase n=1 Tax=Zunongwangia endophytica TaxID=1808945 RepID=A0ABV8HGX8_9FLAO|nr:site-specific integrase [Zunongwangia endophytica]MDN3593432.1 site-specific integrase [Zunongwangia endophytica]
MRTSKTFSVVFWLNKKKVKNNQCLIYARITVNSKRANISLKRSIPFSLWDSKTKRLKGNSRKVVELNEFLDQINARFFQIYQDLKFKGKLITSDLVKAEFNGEGGSSKTLNELIEYHQNKIRNTHSAGSIRNFKVSEKYIKEYVHQRMRTSDIFISQLDYKFLSDFEAFLFNYYPRGHHKAMSHNTVMKHIQRLRKMVTLAFHLEWLDKDPFRRWKMTFEKREREFLSKNELSNLQHAELPIDRLDRIRDLFIFSCYTGLSYGDLMELSEKEINIGIDGKAWIITKRNKTNSAVKVPLLEPALKILEKYKNHPVTQVTDKLLPQCSNQKVNLYLKELAMLVGLKKNLTFHMARHTFATTVTLSNGVPIETVSKLLGHTKIATTQIYARVLEDKISKNMDDLRKRLES